MALGGPSVYAAWWGSEAARQGRVAFAAELGVFQLRTCKEQGVGLLVLGGVIVDNVPAVPGAEEVGIALVVAALHMVVTSAANEGVMAISTVELVVADTTIEIIISCVAF